MDHQFHTPSFGDEDFNIPSYNHQPPSTAIDHHHHHHHPHPHPQQQQQQQQQYQMPPDQQQYQWHHEPPPMYGMQQATPYPMPNNNMHGGMQPQQQQQMHPPPQQQQQMQQGSQQMQAHISPQHNFVQSPPPDTVTHGPSPHGENGTSEDSDDTIPATTLKRPSPDPYMEQNGAKNAMNANKKAKVPKKKKKKDPNEPQKPVSAYALFFRDTQAAIKGQNPNATFGEVSKIVASMWDVLDAEAKNVYKKRTEAAKKEYLKALAAYRANAVSKESGSDQSPTPQNIYSPTHDQQQQQQPQQHHQQQQQQHPPPSPHQQQMHPMQSPPQQVPTHQYQYQSPPHTMHPGMMGPPSHQMSSPSQMMSEHGGHHYGMQQQGGQQQQHQQQQQQHQQQSQIMPGGSPQQPQGGMQPPPPVQQQLCIRHGCKNPAISNNDWEDEYCSNECVITHCRDVFGNWVHEQPQSYSAVK